MSRKLFVGNLPYSVTSERLQEAFSQFGTVSSPKVIVDRETGRSRGFAFLEMETDDQGAAAMQAMNGALLDGRSIAVREAVERQPGLALSVRPSGKTIWKVIYRFSGKPRWLTQGDAKSIGLADAMSVILFAISLVVTMIQIALVGRSARAATGSTEPQSSISPPTSPSKARRTPRPQTSW